MNRKILLRGIVGQEYAYILDLGKFYIIATDTGSGRYFRIKVMTENGEFIHESSGYQCVERAEYNRVSSKKGEALSVKFQDGRSLHLCLINDIWVQADDMVCIKGEDGEVSYLVIFQTDLINIAYVRDKSIVWIKDKDLNYPGGWFFAKEGNKVYVRGWGQGEEMEVGKIVGDKVIEKKIVERSVVGLVQRGEGFDSEMVKVEYIVGEDTAKVVRLV